MPDTQLIDSTESYLKALICDVASLPADFDSRAPFGELGMDSFHALKVIKKLEDRFGQLPKTLLFENFNIDDLARYFVTRHEVTLRAALSAQPAVAAESRLAARETSAASEFTVLPARDAFSDPKVGKLIREIFETHKNESSISRGTRTIAPNVFLGRERRGYFNFSRHKDILLVYAYTGPADHFQALADEIHRYSVGLGAQLNILVDEQLTRVGGVPFTATPFGAIQRIGNLQDFTTEGGAMRRLRYQVSKFTQEGECRTEEYRCGSSVETDCAIVRVIEQWCEGRAKVNPLVHIARDELRAGTFSPEHRVFLTYIGATLQNVIIISPMSAAASGYLMDLEFYPRDMPLGGLEFAIVNIIRTLVAEGCNNLSLGATLGPKLAPSSNADPGVDKLLDDLRAGEIFNDQGNLQFKNKFRPDNKSIFLCRPADSGDPDNVIDIIMMIADPTGTPSVAAPGMPAAMPAATPAGSKAAAPANRPVTVGNESRAAALRQAGNKVLELTHEQVEFDLKTDSWAELKLPSIDARIRELHGRLQEPVDLESSLRGIFPFAHFALADSGRSAEHLFYSACARKGVVLQNLLFPSGLFHQIDKGFVGRELPCEAVFQLQSPTTFKGDLDWSRLEQEIQRDASAIAFVCVEVGNNAAGGAPVSLRHLRSIKELLARHAIPLVIDATRVVENAALISRHEAEYSGRNVWDIVREMLGLADTVVASLSKDFGVHKGGVVATNDSQLFAGLQRVEESEGGGLDFVDRKLIALSLQGKDQIERDVLQKMDSVERIGRALQEQGVPVVSPVGGHCVLIDVARIPEFRQLGQPLASFAAWLFQSTGIRVAPHNAGMQKGTSLNGLVRLAVPIGMERRDIDTVIARLTEAFRSIANIPEVEAAGFMKNQRPVEVRNAPAAEAAAWVAAQPAPESSRAPMDIAIVGMSGRYPKARNPGELWANLVAGRDCLEEIPADRLQRRVRHEQLEKYRGGFVDDVDRFDSLFFNISPREAEMLDPQERLFLETAWECVEDAGYYPESLGESPGESLRESRNVGVFVGAVWAMYQIIGVEQRFAQNEINPNSFFWSIANRVSYWMNLSGPSLTLDTACSSSLTAIYLACEAIRAGECGAAIAGGVNLDLHHSKFDINKSGGALSVDGVCRTFGRGANGYVAGEGVGALLLKPLADALRDHDHVYGIIKSATVNHGGRGSGYAVPNPKVQARLIGAALDRAGIDARTVGYIEAHGTGTELGDPIEMAGLTEAFRARHVNAQSCAIGSIKSNIGHLEAAAGVVGVSKVLLQMKHRQLVPSLHSAELNEHIDFANSPFEVVQKVAPWQGKELDGVGFPLRAGISSFGAGGSNAHIVVEEFRPGERPAAEVIERIFPLSARNEVQLRQQAARLRDHLQGLPSESLHLADLAYTLQIGRKSFEHRAAIVAASAQELIDRLARFSDGVQDPNILTGNVGDAKALTRLLDRKSKDEFIGLVSQQRDCRRLAQLWVGGLIEDWRHSQEHTGVRRMSLPTYPFADKRHWASNKAIGALARAGVHPLIDGNESTFARQLFRKTFSASEFFIHDHLVSGIPTLPGVAYLELARKAGELAAGKRVRRIRNIVWVSPLTVNGAATTAALVELKPNGAEVQFEVFSENESGKRQLYSQGKLGYETAEEERAEPERIDLAAIRARCAKVIEGKDAYPLFHSLGLNLGPSFQVLRDVFKGENEVLGALEIPGNRDGDFDSFVLHPSLVDGSFQAGMAAQLAAGGGGEMFVPYSIGEVEVLRPLQRHCYSYITEARGDQKSRLTRSNVLIVDEEGRILVRIRESVGVPLTNVHEKGVQEKGAHEKAAAPHDDAGFDRLYYRHAWVKTPLAASPPQAERSILLFDSNEELHDLYLERRAAAQGTHYAVLVRPAPAFEELQPNRFGVDPLSSGDYGRLFDALTNRGLEIGDICFTLPVLPNDASCDEQALQTALQNGVQSLLLLCQALVARKLESRARILCLYSGSDSQPQAEAINGFLKSLQLEHPKLRWKSVEIRQPAVSANEILDIVLAELRSEEQASTIVRHEAANRLVRKLEKFDPGTAGATDVAPRKNGAYLITGGAGGLGLIFAEFLAKEYHARLALTGRSELSADGAAKLQALRALGGEVEYFRTDVANRAGVRRLVEQVKSRFGGIDGIIHCAGVLRDSWLRDKTPAQMDAVFAPKVHGTLNLDEATRDEPLDFFAMFSSLAAVAGNVGQCDYAFANHFMDSFAARREALRAAGQRTGKTLSLNWSLWAQGGMKVDEQTEMFFRKNLGIKPLSTATGIDAFLQGLRCSDCQIAVVEGVQEKIERAWGMTRDESPAVQSAAAPASAPVASVAEGAQGELLLAVQNQLSRIVMEFLKIEASDISLDKILLDLGFDSIGLASYANLINEKYGLDLTPVLFFEYPSLGEISRHLVADHRDAVLRVHRLSGAANPSSKPRVESSPAPASDAPVHAEPAFGKKVLAFETPLAAAAAPLSFGSRFADQPIAIVGMSGVMPQSDDLEEFWRNLEAAKDLITVIPADRWNWEEYYGDPLKEVNKSNSKWGGFMKEVDKFDPLFFGISPREAELMDPQQRVFLQTVWKAIEDSGHRIADLSGTKTGLFVGVATNDYIDLMTHHKVPVHAYTSTGNSHSVLVNRISFLLNLRGPSAPIDTACSSSLVALHRAIESIHTGSSDMAIVGGVQVMTSPAGYIAFGQAGMLADDGKCKTFDKRANGYVRGEGSGAILIKPLSMALADGDHIYALIKSTAENHGGKSAALTAPNPNSQSELLIEAYEKAQVDPCAVGYIECHGTGTSLGDPIEIQALKKAFGDLYRKRDLGPPAQPHCGLSSAKTNIGHLETAAGIAGVLKALLSIQHRKIPALVHFEEVNPYINLKGTPFYMVDRTRHWEAPRAGDGSLLPRIAGVSSFGFGGANAHVVLEEYLPAPEEPQPDADPPHMIVLSARTDDRLKAYAQALSGYLERHDVDLRRVAYTLQVGRDPMTERVGLLVSSVAQLREKLNAFAAGQSGVSDLYRGSANGKNGGMNAIFQDEDVRRTIVEECLTRKKLPKLLELWVNGLDFDWKRIYEGATPRRMSLPTYPFARQRYWIDTPQPVATAAAAATASTVVPLRRVNAAVKDAPETRRGELLAVPEWQASPTAWPANAAAANYPNRQVILCEIPGVSLEQIRAVVPGSHCRVVEPPMGQAGGQTLAARFTRAVTQCVEAIRNVLTQEPPAKTLLQIVAPHQGEQVTLAGLSGLLRAAMLESRSITGQVVLVEPQITPDELAFRLEQDRHKPQDALIRYHQGRREVLRWKCVHASWNEPAAQQPKIPFKEQGVYLISGGLGALGLLLTKEILARTGSAKVILAGRSELTEKSRALLANFAPGRVEYRRVDLTDAGQSQQLVAGVIEAHGRLNGILHCAGMVAPDTLANKKAEQIGQVLAPKVAGTVNLDAASAAVDLDFLVLFSSITSTLGSPGSADYAAANGFMDQFAGYRNELAGTGQRQGRCVAVNWPLWREGGMSAGAAVEAWLQETTGMQPLQTATGMRALYRSLELSSAQALVMEGDPARIERFFQVSLEGRVAPSAAAHALAARRIPARAIGDSRRAALVSLLKAELQAFQRGRH